MPKFLVGFISAACALVIGFACGSILTRTDNLRMEELVNSKKNVEIKASELESQIKTFKNEVSQLKTQNQKLRDNLLKSYQANNNDSPNDGTK